MKVKTMVLALGAVLVTACGPAAVRAQDSEAHAPTAPSATTQPPLTPAPSASAPMEASSLAAGEVKLSTEGLHPSIAIVPAKDWTTLEIAGFKNKGLATAMSNDFRPNLNIVEEASEVSWESYLNGTFTALAQAGYKTEKPTDFPTDKMGTMKRFVGTATMQKRQLVQRFYIHKAAKSFFVLTCSRVVQNAPSLDDACDAMVRTFRIVD